MIYTKTINDKVYVENEFQCLARMCRYSMEVFGDTENEFENKFYYCIKNHNPTIKDWELFKSKVKDVYGYIVDDDYIPETWVLLYKT